MRVVSFSCVVRTGCFMWHLDFGSFLVDCSLSWYCWWRVEARVNYIYDGCWAV